METREEQKHHGQSVQSVTQERVSRKVFYEQNSKIRMMGKKMELIQKRRADHHVTIMYVSWSLTAGDGDDLRAVDL